MLRDSKCCEKKGERSFLHFSSQLRLAFGIEFAFAFAFGISIAWAGCILERRED